MEGKNTRGGVSRLALFGVAYIVSLLLVFAIVPYDFGNLERLALALFAVLFAVVFGPFLLVTGLPCGFLNGEFHWQWLLVLVPAYLAHVVFIVVISRKTSLWRRIGRCGETLRRGAVALMVAASAAAIWYEVPIVEEFRVSCDSAKLNGRMLRFAVVTDLHSCLYGEGQRQLVKAVLDAKPDALLLVGDMFDDRLGDDNVKAFISQMIPLMPCLYVTGNHEFWGDHMDANLRWLWKAGVITLAGDCRTINIKGINVDFCGIDDPTYIYDEGWLEELERAYSQSNPSHLRILLSHRPEYDWAFVNYDFDVVVSGHLHGGQWRLPLLNIGVFGPDGNRFLPKFSNGIYALPNGTRLALSRGLARESVPLPRFFNHPELMIFSVHSNPQ